MGDEINNSISKQKRSSKTSRNQYLIYLNELDSNVFFRENAFNPKEDPKLISNVWEKLTTALNSVGGGPIKDVNGWKRVCTLMKMYGH